MDHFNADLALKKRRSIMLNTTGQKPLATIWATLFMELHERSSNDMYVLRLWLESDWGEGTPAGWRFSLEDPHTGVLRGFGSLFDLTIFLEGKMTDLAQQYFSRDATE